MALGSNIEKKDYEHTGVVVVMPAYNAASTLEKTYRDIPVGSASDVILVDDGSHDETVSIAHSLDIKVFRHLSNHGYGGNQKTCYAEALKTDNDIVVMLHPDYQYDPSFLPEVVRPIYEGRADVVFGSRLLGESPVKQGMPWWKYLGNRFLTIIENLVFGIHLSEYHTGYRAYSRKILEAINFQANSDNFVFDQEIIAQIVLSGYRIVEVPIPTKYFPEASSASFLQSSKYGLSILLLLFRYWLHVHGIRKNSQFVNCSQRYHLIESP